MGGFGRGAGAGVDDGAGLAPGGGEAGAGCGVFELDDEVGEVGDLGAEGGDVGLDFFEEGAAVDELAAGEVHERGVGVERGGE